MAAVWPPSLPQVPLAAAFDEQLPDVVLRTEMDAGPAKTRRRFAVGVGTLAVTMFLDEAQQVTFDAFYGTTVEGGALRFEFTHPRTGATREMRTVNPVALPKHKPNLFRLQMQLEVLP